MGKVPEALLKERQFLRRKIKALFSEYKAKVSFNFSRYLYVGVKENRRPELVNLVKLITTCAGYQAHRLVLYKNSFVTNIYVRFADEKYAQSAALRLLPQEDYCVDKVEAMLQAWYVEEMMKGKFPWTLAIVSIEGRSEIPDPLSHEQLQSMLMQFGDPKINAYQNGHQIEHVQVLFSSMAEALGACIAHGCWIEGDTSPRCYYNIQIMSSEKEATLLRGIQTKHVDEHVDQNVEAFEMDYFVQKMEIKQSNRDDTYWLTSPAQATSQNFRSPRVREFRRQFSRGRGNGGRVQNENYRCSPNENKNFRRQPNHAIQVPFACIF